MNPETNKRRFTDIDTHLSNCYLPSREICYAYAAAMCFAQHFELNLRSFLYTMDYYGLVEEIPLKDEERKRFKNFDGFIDKSTCGLLVEKLKGTSALKTPKASKILGRACEHRNRLAHRYLMEHEFSPEMTDNAMRSILHELHLMTMDLYVALVISQAYLDHAQHESDRRERVWCKFNEELGLPTYEDMKRKYVLPSKWKTSKQ